MEYNGNEDAYEEAFNILEDRLQSNAMIAGVNGAGKCIDFRVEDQTNTEFGTSEHTRENWTKGDTSESNEAFRADPTVELEQLTSKGVLTFRGVNCVIYDHSGGKGEREFGLWLKYYFDAEKVLEMEKTGELRRITKDPMRY